MTKPLRLALTADLHWGSVRTAGDEATRLLVGELHHQPPDVLVIAGDIGTAEHFGQCLELFASLPCVKAVVPGNHDLWVTAGDPRGDSLQVYREVLPRVCEQLGFHYLDSGPLLLAESGLALVGSINWYDYSWSLEQLREQVPDWEERLRTKRFLRGHHNDGRFIRWPLDDTRFTAEVVATLEKHLVQALEQVPQAIVVTHHPPFYGLNFPPSEDTSPSIDRLLWEAFSGNRSLEQLLARHEDCIPFAFCGHTHRARENRLGAIHGCNIGGDYHFKRLLLLDWPAGTIEARVFGEP